MSATAITPISLPAVMARGVAQESSTSIMRVDFSSTTPCSRTEEFITEITNRMMASATGMTEAMPFSTGVPGGVRLSTGAGLFKRSASRSAGA